MEIVLHHARFTRSARVRWLLEELGVPYELVRVDFAAGAHRQPAYQAVHPLGQLPALTLDGETMIESGAMLVHLADRFADRGLAPAVDAPERAAYLQWIFYTTATLEPPLVDLFWKSPDPAIKAVGKAKFDAACQPLIATLADGRPHLLGDRFTAADIAIGSVLGFARGLGQLTDPTLLDYGRRIGSRPAAKASRAD